jgi:tRNA(adenine34) deaminase
MSEKEDDSSSRWMQKALLLAEKAAKQGEVPVGAVVVLGGKIIGRGYNRRESRADPIAHAEIAALQAASRRLGSWRLLDCKLYVTLEPCPMCLAACQQARVLEVIYGARDPKGGAISLGYMVHEDVRTNHRFPVRTHEDARCGEILSQFFRARRKAKQKRKE